MTSAISVIIPTCDRPELVKRAVESVLNQSRPPSEIIIVDNGYVAAPDHYQDARIKLLRTRPRIGMSEARNAGARSAAGDVLAFLDDDDTWDREFLERMLEEYHRSDTTVVCAGSIIRVDASGQRLSQKSWPKSPSDQRQIFYRNPGFGGCNILIEKNLFRRIGGFDRRFRASEDRDLAARLITANVPILSVPEAKIFALEHQGSRSSPHHLMGNILFVRKHWAVMQNEERSKALQTIALRIRGRVERRINNIRWFLGREKP